MVHVTAVIPVTLPNGTQIRVEARPLNGTGKKEQVGIKNLPFADLIPSIEGISAAMLAAVKTVAPKKATVEFGIEASIESGKLIALLCSGEATANLKITLEWEPGS